MRGVSPRSAPLPSVWLVFSAVFGARGLGPGGSGLGVSGATLCLAQSPIFRSARGVGPPGRGGLGGGGFGTF